MPSQSIHATIAHVKEATTFAQLVAAWESRSPGLNPDEVASLQEALTAKRNELEKAAETREDNDEAHLAKVKDTIGKIDYNLERGLSESVNYGTMLAEYARAESNYRRLRAKAWLRYKAGESVTGAAKVTDGEAERSMEGDDEVNAAKLDALIWEGKVRAQRSLLDYLGHEFDHLRSLFVRERAVDERLT